MKLFKVVGLLGLFCCQAALAATNSETLKSILEKQPSCGVFVRFDQTNMYLGSGSSVKMIDLKTEEPRVLTTGAAARDILTDGTTGFVLTGNSLEEWDLERAVRLRDYQTYAYAGEFANQEQPKALARYKDKVIIAHGRLGVSFFNLSTKRLTNQFRLLTWQRLESMATGVAVSGKYAYVVMDNFHLVKPPAKPAFRGFVVIDMETEKVVAELDGMDPGVTSVNADGNVILPSFGGSTIWKYSTESLKGKTIPEPLLRVWSYPIKGHPTGIASVDDKYYYTCYLKAPAKPGDNGGYYTNIPVALDRRVLMLD